LRIRQLYEVRGAIDALAARLAARRVKADAAGRAHLEAALPPAAPRQCDAAAQLIALDVDFTARSIGFPAIPRSRK